MGKIIDFFLGKEIIEQIDVESAVAIMTLDDSTKETVSDTGHVLHLGRNVYAYTGSNELRGYFSRARSFVQSDSGKMIPVHKINSVEITFTPFLKTVKRRT